MGVKNLWSILKELGEDRNITFLSGKRIAVDLSIWVFQALTTEGLKEKKKPHLSLLTDRVYPLIQKGILPIFVIEGKVPDLKRTNKNILSREKWDRLLKECQVLLKSLGVPCIKASGEAEAGCAFLYLKQKVDGVLTEDSDALLYGAEVVYRYKNKGNRDHVKMYSLKSEKNKLNLDRTKLVSIALLLGCDYEEGVPTIGEETVKKFLELHKNQDYDIFQRFKDWKVMDEAHLFPGCYFNLKKPSHCKRCLHEGTETKHRKLECEVCGSKSCSSELEIPCPCAWHKNDEFINEFKNEYKIYKAVKEMPKMGRGDFPNLKVIDEYLNYTDEVPNEDFLEWKRPNQHDFLGIASTISQRTSDSPQKYILKFMTAWQLDKLSKDPEFDQTDFLYEPVKILCQFTHDGEKFYEVKWTLKDNQGSCSPDETKEFAKIFQKAYPKLTELFEKGPAQRQEISQF